MAQHKETAVADLKWVSDEDWERKIEDIRRDGERYAKKIQQQGRPFQARILSPKEASKSGLGFSIRAVKIDSDWKAQTKLAMVEDANNFLTKALEIDILPPNFADVLGAVIAEESLILERK